MEWVAGLLIISSVLAILYEVVRVWRRYQDAQKLAETYGIPYEKQFLPFDAIVLLFLPNFLASFFWPRNLLFSDTMIGFFKKHDSNLIGLVSYTGLNVFVK